MLFKENDNGFPYLSEMIKFAFTNECMDFALEKLRLINRRLQFYKAKFEELLSRTAQLNEENALLQQEIGRLRMENEALREQLKNEALTQQWVGNHSSARAAREQLDNMIRSVNRIIETLKHEAGES